MNKLRVIKQNLKENLLEYLLYFFIFLLPWQTRWVFRDYFIQGEIFEYGRMSLYTFDIILIFVLIYYFIKLIKDKKIIKIKNQILGIKCQISNVLPANWLGLQGDWRSGKCQIFFISLLFVAYCLLSMIWSSDKLISLYWGIRMLMGWGLFYLLQKINFSKIKLAMTIVSVGLIQGLLGIYQFFNQEIVGNKWLGIASQKAQELGVSVVEFGLERWLRAYGSLSHPNIYGTLLVLSFIGMIYLIGKIKNKYQKLFVLFSTIFIVLGIILSFSRAAWLVFGLVFICGFIWSYKIIKDKWQKNFIKWLALMLISVIVFVSYMVLPIIKTRLGVGGMERLEIKSKVERISGYHQAGELLKNNWLIGAGIGNYTLALQEAYESVAMRKYNVWSLQAVHNVYLLILVELGVLGFLIIILFNGYLVKLLIKRKKWDFVFVLSCFYVLMLFDHWWWTTASGLYIIWIIIGLGVKSLKSESHKVES